MTISLGYTIFYVNDVAETVRFFTTAFGLEQRFIAGADRVAFVGSSWLMASRWWRRSSRIVRFSGSHRNVPESGTHDTQNRIWDHSNPDGPCARKWVA